ncbi:g1637 [Coccomyxa viridis]|uniref:G1637 protein n=1 Tax=Coccomyxa viridis TaxID=1274662 RepID=A0ABP1FM79_9CHLO
MMLSCSFRASQLVTLRGSNVRLVQNAARILPIDPQACQRTRRTFVTSAAVQQSEAASSEQTSASNSSTVDWEAFDAHQRQTPRLSHAEEARLLLDSAGTGVLSTIGSFGAWTGFPVGTVVEYAMDGGGKPVFAFSSLSSHTPDIKADPRCSLTVTAQDFQGMSSGRVTVAGKMALLEGADAADAKKAFLAKNPNSFWVEFGDFAWFRMDSVATARLVGGFGRIKQISAEEFAAAKSDPVAQFAGPIAQHMNADHADSTAAMVRHYVGVNVESASILSLDRLGLAVECKADGKAFSCRVPFVRPAGNRKDIKDIIVEMTRAAAAK